MDELASRVEVEVSRCHDPGRGEDIGGGLKLCHMPRQIGHGDTDYP